MVKIIGSVVIVLILLTIFASPVFADTPNDNAPCVSICANQMGGQQVASCTQLMEYGVSVCAQMDGCCAY